jgi:hypothetical protein
MRIRFQPFAALGLVVSLLLSAASVAAQDQRDAWSRVSLLSGGTKLSVKLKTGKTINGEFRTASDTTLSLTAKNAPLEVRREEIATVHEVTKKSATKATLIGAGAGAAAGAITDSANDDGFEKLDSAATGVLTVAGAGVGALVGFLVGRSGNKRVLVYEAK